MFEASSKQSNCIRVCQTSQRLVVTVSAKVTPSDVQPIQFDHIHTGAIQYKLILKMP